MNRYTIAKFVSLLAFISCTDSPPLHRPSINLHHSSSRTNDTPPEHHSARASITFNQNFKLDLPPSWSIQKDSTGLHSNLVLVRNSETSDQFQIEFIKKSKGEPDQTISLSRNDLKVWQNKLQEVEKLAQFQTPLSHLEGRELHVIGKSRQDDHVSIRSLIASGETHYYRLVYTSYELEKSEEVWNTIKSSFSYTGKKSLSQSQKSNQPSQNLSYNETGIDFKLPLNTWYQIEDHESLLNSPQAIYTTENDSNLLVLFSTHLANEKVKTNDIFNAILLNHGIEPSSALLTARYLKRQQDHEIILYSYQDAKKPNHTIKGAYHRDGAYVYTISVIGQRNFITNYPVKNQFLQKNRTQGTPSDLSTRSLAELLNQIGIMKLANDKPMVALSYFEKANKLNPEKPLYLLNCGFVYQLKNLDIPGIKHFESQFKLVREHGRLLWVLGEMYEKRAQYQQAMDAYLLAKNFYPDDEELIINLSDAYWGAGYKMMSLRIIEDLHKKRPSKRLGIYLAKTLIGLERHNDGIALLLELKDQHGLSAQLGLPLLKALLYLERFEEALALQAQIAAKIGHNEHTYFAKGKSEFYLKQFKQAEISLSKSLALEGANDEASSLLAATQSYLGKGRSKELKRKIRPTFKISKIADRVAKDWRPEAEQGALVHYSKESLKFNQENAWSLTTEVLIEIVDSSGIARFQEFNESFIPGYDRIHINHLQTYDSQLRKKWRGSHKYYYVTAELGSEISKQTQLAHLPIKRLSVGDFIQLQITREAVRPARYIPYLKHIANRDIPVHTDIFEIQNPPDELDFEEFGDVSEKTGGANFVWTFKEPKTIMSEPLMPSIEEIASGVSISEARTWASVGKEYEDLIKHQFEQSIPVKEKALELKGNHHDLQFIVDSTIAWIRKNVKYRDIKIVGSSLIPAKSAQTLSNYQGDCKDQSLLLKEILSEFGIMSDLVLINLNQPVSSATATIQQFNHMILHIPPNQGIREQFIDLTEIVGSHRIIPYSLEGKNALVIQGDSSRLMTTPILENSSEHQAKFDHSYFLNEDGSLEIKEKITLDGKFGALFREKLFGFTNSQMREYLRRWFAIEVPNIQVQTLKLHNMDDFTEPFRLEIILRSAGYWDKKSAEPITLPNIWERTLMRLPQSNNRLYPIKIPDQMIFHSIARMKTPDNFRIFYPKTRNNSSLNGQFTEYSAKSEQNPTSFNLSTEWTTYAAFAAPSEYLKLREEWNAILGQTLVQIQVVSDEP